MMVKYIRGVREESTRLSDFRPSCYQRWTVWKSCPQTIRACYHANCQIQRMDKVLGLELGADDYVK